MSKKLDKRTKEYKEWKANFENQSKGLGDTIDKITTKTGIKKIVKTVLSDDCGCDERKDILNKIIPYKVYNCFTDTEYNYIKDIVDSKTNTLDYNQQFELKKIYERVFNRKYSTTCLQCAFTKQIFNPLKKLYENY